MYGTVTESPGSCVSLLSLAPPSRTLWRTRTASEAQAAMLYTLYHILHILYFIRYTLYFILYTLYFILRLRKGGAREEEARAQGKGERGARAQEDARAEEAQERWAHESAPAAKSGRYLKYKV